MGKLSDLLQDSLRQSKSLTLFKCVCVMLPLAAFIIYQPTCFCGRHTIFKRDAKTLYEGDEIHADFFTGDGKRNYIESFESVSEKKLPLAVVDMSEATSNPAKVAFQIINALETVGFMYLKNVPQFDDEQLLQLTHWFFDLPVSHKRNVTRKNWREDSNQIYRGYFPVIPEWTSYKEGFEIGAYEGTAKIKPGSGHTLRDTLHEPNIWPNGSDSEETEHFKTSMKHFFNIFDTLSTGIMKLLALGLGLNESTVVSMFQPNPLSTLRLIHYPPRPPHHIPPEAMDDDIILHCDKHADSGFITFLSTFNYRGLQILDNNQWVDVPPLKNAIVTNIGLNMAAVSGERFKATVHRVVDLGKSRYSVAFFTEPPYDTIVSKTFWGRDIEGMPANFKYGPWTMNNTGQYAENSETDWGTV